MLKIVIDTYGADNGVEPIINGVATAIKENSEFNAVLVGDKSIILPILEQADIPHDRFEIIDTDKYITNNDPPTCVFGGNDDTSMVMAYSRLKGDDDCVAMLSPGNTGALLVGSICRLGLFGSLKFPVLSTAIPSLAGHLVCLADCGANTDCTPKDLARFAIMGNVFSKGICGIENPKVGLLCVGREEQKGNALTKEAFKLISELDLNFIGNIEGSDIVTGYADVVVSDGFSGNLMLKNTEAVGKAAMSIIDGIAGDTADSTVTAIKQQLFKTFDLNSQGGATFLGTRKIVVKMHGCATDKTVVSCIDLTLRLHKAGFSDMMKTAVDKF